MVATCISVGCGSLSALWDNRLRSIGVSRGKLSRITLVVLCISAGYFHAISALVAAQEVALSDDRCEHS